MTTSAPRPWRVDRKSAGRHWKDSCSILDADGGEVCVLTRGYQDGPSWHKAELIVAAVNSYGKPMKFPADQSDDFPWLK